MKVREKNLIERSEVGYYSCKAKHSLANTRIIEALEPYLTDDTLKQLHHTSHTPTNEAMNQSVALYVPENKTFQKQIALIPGLTLQQQFR